MRDDDSGEIPTHVAVSIYARTEISVSRGAELAGLTQTEFLARLDEHGVEPRYGPDSVAELYSGPDLMED